MILVASTVAAHACDGKTEFNWLVHRSAWVGRYGFFLSAQLGQGHDDKVWPLIDTVRGMGGTVWLYSLDQGEDVVTSDNRLPAIAAGRNLVHEYVTFHPTYTHVQWIDTDIIPTSDGIEKLRQVDHPIVGAHVPAYCHDGPKVPAEHVPDGSDVREHWTTAGGLLMTREVIKALRWRSDKEDKLSEDPAFQIDAISSGFGQTWVRHDVVWSHQPLVALEYRGRDLSVKR